MLALDSGSMARISVQCCLIIKIYIIILNKSIEYWSKEGGTPVSKNGNRKDKEHLYALFSRIGGALANPHRLELLDLLVQSPRTVEELADQAHMSITNTSQHLQRLKQAHLVVDKRSGQFIRYAVADPSIASLWMDLRGVAERQLAELEPTLNQYRPRRHAINQITAADLQDGLRQGSAVLIDVRPAIEYQARHLPEALSLPLDTLEERIGELPQGKTIVAYCRGPYCVYADQALELLANRGWKVARLEEGVAEWQATGYRLAA